MNTVIATGNCPQCGSADVRKLASVYSAGMGGVITAKGEGFSGTSASGLALMADPPQKMANWTGWTLSLLLWLPTLLIWLFIAVQHANSGLTWQQETIGPLAFITAAIAAIAVWSIPAWMQRRKAHRYNSDIWAPAMKRWHEASVCLNCCKVYA
jgi:hypothetical protein